MRAQSNGQHPDLQAALSHLLSAGGKRVRPTVALLSAGLLDADMDRSVTLAAAVELLHTATLVHDDLIDGALLRRGNPTLNAEWSPAATILAGDFIFARAAELAASTESIETMRMFARTLSTVVNGELTQMFKSKWLVSRENYFERIYAKTASMFELATEAAVYLSDKDEALFEAMRTYGYEIGMAFQIVDDILDFTSDAQELGKPVANDLRQGLITLPALYYFENHPDDPALVSLTKSVNPSNDLMQRIVRAIRESGAIHKAMDEATQFVQRGIAALAIMPPSLERQALENLAAYVVDREI